MAARCAAAGVRRTMIAVFVVARVRLYREGLAEFLRGAELTEAVGAAADWDAAAEAVEEVRPDVVLFDLALAGGVNAIRTAVSAAPTTKFVAFGISEDEAEVVACAEAGVAGYVTRDDSLDELVGVLESVARGEMLCSPRIAATLLRRVAALATERSAAWAVGAAYAPRVPRRCGRSSPISMRPRSRSTTSPVARSRPRWRRGPPSSPGSRGSGACPFVWPGSCRSPATAAGWPSSRTAKLCRSPATTWAAGG
jgi:DNA-binding NarL/FixJ family response regulator